MITEPPNITNLDSYKLDVISTHLLNGENCPSTEYSYANTNSYHHYYSYWLYVISHLGPDHIVSHPCWLSPPHWLPHCC